MSVVITEEYNIMVDSE